MSEPYGEPASTFREWLYQRRYPVILGVILIGAGMALGPLVFTGLSTGRAVLGGAFFGAFCMLCAAAQRLF